MPLAKLQPSLARKNGGAPQLSEGQSPVPEIHGRGSKGSSIRSARVAQEPHLQVQRRLHTDPSSVQMHSAPGFQRPLPSLAWSLALELRALGPCHCEEMGPEGRQLDTWGPSVDAAAPRARLWSFFGHCPRWWGIK
mmetsp:Transcript_67880/g.93986  ORF Transcript_67880/g.93986 Transcript_67880/m.93986 type:complete len:136 (-) Transcript_67880:1600-2007(-)